ncbi:cellulose binding domain-containing protein [Peterkaempfera bronchialis]|uniref:Alpha-L-arabinofuranosidase n=1 Tax=Peterkaempfera bronchialis TaxID=2126346 RepID=A0A345T3G4_9ACTN|nr:cellulose binding domain-containing protein [Peterkaempfera bronchialis]AXI80519.1 alpha-L-arabinofuranosidase [Peterkaempfera bronchialis]
MPPLHSTPRRLRRPARTAAALAATLTAALLAALPATGQAAAADAPPPADVDVTVNAHAGLGVLDETARGVNAAIWDSHMNDPEVATLMKAAGVGAMRYPGGSYSDIYHWKDHTAPGGYVAPGTGFDDFMGTVKATGAQPVIIANYGSGTPQEAADWVRYANVEKHYGAKYWEIGNEIYGNGHYGSGWENDIHADKSPAEYARQVLAYAAAMKAVDPTVKIGAVLTMPGNWPDGVIGDGEAADWNHTVLAAVAHDVDFVSVHWYAGGDNADQALAKVAQLPGELREVRSQLDRYAGADSARIGIAMTEINTNTGGSRLTGRPNGLFTADAVMTALENGVFTVDWWDTHNGADGITTVDGETDYGDMGMLSNATCTGTVCEPAANTPFHPYYGLKMLTALGSTGDTMVAAGSTGRQVSAHAVQRANGDLSVLLVNKDPNAAQSVDLHYSGFTPAAGTPDVRRYARGDSDLANATGTASASRVSLPPYSLTTLTLHPKAGSGPSPVVSTPGAPRTTAVTDTSATLSWGASTGSVTRYEVYERLGTNVQLLGESTGTSATLRNLPPGSTHTVSVLARDAAGRLSVPSVPLTFTTGSPQRSNCAVTYHVDSGWGNGFVATVTLTNLADTAIDGWSLDFDWPTPGQSVSSAWNASVTDNGGRVHVTGDGRLAPKGGSTASFGFVGANDGPNPAPTAFRLNGTVCTIG